MALVWEEISPKASSGDDSFRIFASDFHISQLAGLACFVNLVS
jgi:hypothetical protein